MIETFLTWPRTICTRLTRTSLECKIGKLSVSLRCSVRERSFSDAESKGRQQAIHEGKARVSHSLHASLQTVDKPHCNGRGFAHDRPTMLCIHLVLLAKLTVSYCCSATLSYSHCVSDKRNRRCLVYVAILEITHMLYPTYVCSFSLHNY